MTALYAEDFVLALGAALLFCGGAVTTFSSNALKRAGGAALGLCGAVACLAALRASPSVLMAGAVAAFVFAAVGVALAVRAQEAYGGGDISEYDAADQASTPKEDAT